MRKLIFALLGCAVITLGPERARACSGGAPFYGAIPRPGAEVSPGTSINIWGYQPAPTDLSVTAGGVELTLGNPVDLGVMYPETVSHAWQIAIASEPNTEYAVSAPDSTGKVFELTRFRTTASVPAGTAGPPLIRSFTPMLVHFSEVGGGSCVQKEDESHVDLDFAPAFIPNTDAASTLYTLHLRDRAVCSAEPCPLWDVSFTGAEPLPVLAGAGVWTVDMYYYSFTSDHFYCADLVARGDADSVRGSLVSNTECATPTGPSPREPGHSGCALAGRPRPGAFAWLALAPLALCVARRRCVSAANRPGRSFPG